MLVSYKNEVSVLSAFYFLRIEVNNQVPLGTVTIVTEPGQPLNEFFDRRVLLSENQLSPRYAQAIKARRAERISTNPKYELLNPKQIQMSKIQTTKRPKKFSITYVLQVGEFNLPRFGATGYRGQTFAQKQINSPGAAVTGLRRGKGKNQTLQATTLEPT